MYILLGKYVVLKISCCLVMHAQQVMYILLGKYVVKYLVASHTCGAKTLDKTYCKCFFNLFVSLKKTLSSALLRRLLHNLS